MARQPKPEREEQPEIVATRKEAARLLGISDRSLGDWKKIPGCPDCSAGYDIGKLRAFQATFGRKGSESHKDATDVQLALKREKLEQERLKTEAMRREAEVAAGNLIPRAEYFLFANETITQARDLLLAIPIEMKKHLPRNLHDKAGELARMIETALKKLADLAEGPPKE